MCNRAVLRLIAVIGMMLCPHQVQPVAAQDLQREQELFRAIDRNRESHVEFLRSLIRAQPGGEEAVQALVVARFEELGLEVETLRLLPTRLNLDVEFAVEEMIEMTERSA